jgi:4-hydroxythreonine-4-phosphate dehydrogenase
MRAARIGVTLGDPAGIGPEIVARALALDGDDDVIVLGDRALLERAAALVGVRAPRAIVEVTALAQPPAAGSVESGRAQVAYLEAAIARALAGELDALVTAPIHKASCIAAGFAFPGHTELLAERFERRRRVAMMLAGPRLRVVPVTTHIALADVPRALTVDGIARAIALTVRALHDDFGIERPRVAVCALNPHAGEGGHFGDEEATIITPALRSVADGPLAEELAFTLTGPHVPDVVFRQAAAPPFGEGRFDAVVAMYHDQALIPLKLIDFDAAVNVTLGLPIVRTSPDHGVAHDIAWRGVARPESLRAALALARQLVARRSLRADS